MKKYITYEDVLTELDKAVAEAGSQEAFASQHGFTAAYVSMVRRKKRSPGMTILKALGIGRHIEVRYTKLKE
jgi:hypothetical protein